MFNVSSAHFTEPNMDYELKNYLLRMRTKCQEEKYGNDGSRQIKMFPLNIFITHFKAFLKMLHLSLRRQSTLEITQYLLKTPSLYMEL